jgi:hypothetical protein
MQYVPPYGVADTNAPYVNGDPSIARQGSIPPAEAFEHPMREIVNVITKNLMVPSKADLAQMLEANRSQRCNFCKDTGTTNNLSVTFDPPMSKYTIGLPLRVQVRTTNTGGVTIDAGAGRVGCKRPDGSNIQPGDMPAGGIVDLVFDGTYFQMVNYLGGASTGSITNVFSNIPYAVDTSITPNIITAAFTPAITSLVAGLVVLIKIANTNTADTVVNINTFNNKQVVAEMGGGKLMPGDVMAGDVKLFVYDGTNFFIAPNVMIPNTVTINVPTTQWPTVDSAMLGLNRKTLAKGATVTIKLASGVYPAITIRHPYADGIVIQGTMIGNPPVVTDWGSNAASNLAMLRARYGTEVHAFNEVNGIANLGPGKPKIADLLIVGDGSRCSGMDTYYGSIQTNNVSVAMATWGFRGLHGVMDLTGGGATGCINGVTSEQGRVNADRCAFVANSSAGSQAQYGGVLGMYACLCNWNGYGLVCYAGAVTGVTYGQIAGNSFDCTAAINSSISLNGVSVYTFSPPLNTVGSAGGIIYG